jgi:hypothetical protein
MANKKAKEKKQTETITDQSDEKVKKSADASLGAEAKKELTENLNIKESEMVDKDNVKKHDIKKSNDDKGAVTEDIKAAEKKETEENGLAPGVTLDPQNDEQLDLNLMEDPVAVSKISVPTDNDEGEFLEDTEGIKEVRKFIDENRDKEGDELNDAELLKSGTEVAANFNKKLSFKEAITIAVLTKYFLLYGMALIILKDAVKEIGQNWIYYYKTHFIPSTYSSAIKYMKLARIPDVIRYAFLGLERLEKIYTAIKDDYDMAGADPIGKFFSDSSISIDFHDCEVENFKYDIDAAVANTRINNFFKDMNDGEPKDNQVENTVDSSLVEDLIRKDKKVEAGLMEDLFLHAKGGADPNVLLEEYLKTDSKILKRIKKNLTATKTVEGFPKLISELKSKVSFLTKNTALVKEVTIQHVNDLQKEVTALRKLVNAQIKSE